VLANPVAMPVVNVQSPINNQNYPTNNIKLKTTAYAVPSSVNFSITYYVLDDQQAAPTNGSTILSDLSSGSHTLKLYGTRSVFDYYTNSTKKYNDELGSVVYFSVIYSTQWVIFTVILVLFLAITSLVLFKKRRQIKAALKRPKRDVFFVGVVMLFFSGMFTIYFAWQVAYNYLFPYWPPKFMASNPNLNFIFSLIFFSLSLLLMLSGTHKKAELPKPNAI
jgi:hypothetical protein